MAERTLRVNIIGDERDLLRAFGSSARGSRAFEAQMTGVSRSVRNVFAAAGVALGATAIVQAFRSTISAAIDFESSFAGVRKTVDATEPQLRALATGFRDLSKEIPVSVDELSRIGEAAGQLGIQQGAILDFTKIVADLGATTNLAADEAANALARIANITQLPQDQFDNLGSTVADLGNKLAATESEIVDFGLRIAAAGKIVGLTVDETLAIAGAFTSVGVEAEAGGTAVSKVFISLANAVKTGGKQLELFADTAGTSTAEFRRQFETNTSAAFVAFVEGLKRVDAEGGNVFKTLKDLGLTDQRLIRAFLSISQSGDLLNRSLATGSRAWEENSALQIEAAKRYETTASKLQIFQNRVNDLQITLGNVLAPALLEIITPLGKWLESTENQERVQRALIQTMEDARSVFEGVRSVVVPLAEGVKSLADRMGGLDDAVKLLLIAMVASKVANFGLALAGLGPSALASRAGVNALRLSLLRLGAIGVITIGVEVLLNKDTIDDKVRGFLREHKLGFLAGGGQIELPVGINAAQLNIVRNQIAAIKGDGDLVVKALDAAIQKLIEAGRTGDSKLIEAARRSRAAAKARADDALAERRGRGENSRLLTFEQAPVAALEAAAKQTAFNFKKLMNSLDLDLERALGTSSLSDNVSVFRKIEAAIKARIAAVGKTFKLSMQLIQTQNQISQALESQAAEVKQKSQDAFDALVDSLSLSLERAQVTPGSQDNLNALKEIESAILARIKAEGETTDLARQLFQNREAQKVVQSEKAQTVFDTLVDELGLKLERAEVTTSLNNDLNVLKQIESAILARIKAEGRTVDLARQLFQNRQAQADAIAEQRNAKQFEALGLTAEGGKRTPSAGALLRRLGTVENLVEGTFLDTPKTAAKLAEIGNVLSKDLGEVGKKVRDAALQMLNDITSALDDKGTQGKLTAHRITDPRKILEGLGLSPEEFNQLYSRMISQSSGGGFRTTPGQGAFGFSTFGAGDPAIASAGFGGGLGGAMIFNGDITVISDDPDEMGRALGKKGRRAIKSRGGRFAGNRGL